MRERLSTGTASCIASMRAFVPVLRRVFTNPAICSSVAPIFFKSVAMRAACTFPSPNIVSSTNCTSSCATAFGVSWSCFNASFCVPGAGAFSPPSSASSVAPLAVPASSPSDSSFSASVSISSMRRRFSSASWLKSVLSPIAFSRFVTPICSSFALSTSRACANASFALRSRVNASIAS